MSPAANAAYANEDSFEYFSPDDVQHVWLPSHRSLCDLASQRYEPDEGATINDRAHGLPVCGACEVVVGMLARRLQALRDTGTGTSPADPQDAAGLLGFTRWTWVSASLR